MTDRYRAWAAGVARACFAAAALAIIIVTSAGMASVIIAAVLP